MDTQKESARQDDNNISDKATDLNRSQNREGAAPGNADADGPMEAAHGHHGGNETGSHQEGAYDKDHQEPLVDEDELAS